MFLNSHAIIICQKTKLQTQTNKLRAVHMISMLLGMQTDFTIFW